jgi:hypothetical protein
VAHAGVDDDRLVGTDPRPQGREQVDGRHTAVKLPTAMIREMEPGYTKIERTSGVVGPQWALQQQRPRPTLTDCLDVGPIQRS